LFFYFILSFRFKIKRRAKISVFLPAGTASFIFSLNQAPGILQLLLKRPKVDIQNDAVSAFKVFWHLPQVPADAASAILE